ncbi:hypothetical protein GGI05_005637, partial [Coemansia sp. RSA 2603]
AGIRHVDPRIETNAGRLKKYLAFYDACRAEMLNTNIATLNGGVRRQDNVASAIHYYAVLMHHTAARITQLEGGVAVSDNNSLKAIDVPTPTSATTQSNTPDSSIVGASKADSVEQEAMDVDVVEEQTTPASLKHGIDDIATIRSLLQASLAPGADQKTKSDTDKAQFEELSTLLNSLYDRLFQTATHSVQGVNNAEIVVTQLVEAVLAKELDKVEKLIQSVSSASVNGAKIYVSNGQAQIPSASLQAPLTYATKGSAENLMSPPATAHTGQQIQANVAVASTPALSTPPAQGYNSLGVLLTPISTDRPYSGVQEPTAASSNATGPQSATIQRTNTSVPASRLPPMPQTRPPPPRPLNNSAAAALATRPPFRPPAPSAAARPPIHQPQYTGRPSGSVTAGINMTRTPGNGRPRPQTFNRPSNHPGERPSPPIAPAGIRRQSAPVDIVAAPLNINPQSSSHPASRRNSAQYMVTRATDSQSPIMTLSIPTTSVAIVSGQTNALGVVQQASRQASSSPMLSRPEHWYIAWSKIIDGPPIIALKRLMEWGLNECKAKNKVYQENVANTAIMLYNLIITTLDNFEPPAITSDVNGVTAAYWALRASIDKMLTTVDMDV